MIITVMESRHGAREPSVAKNLAIELQRRGRRPTVAIAGEAQRKVQTWATSRVKAGFDPIPVLGVQENVVAALQNLRKSYDDVVLDLDLEDSVEMRTGALASETLVICTLPLRHLREALESLERTVTELFYFHSDLAVVVALTGVSTRSGCHQIEQAKSFLDDFPDFSLAESVLPAIPEWRISRGSEKGGIELRGESLSALQKLTSEIIAASHGIEAPSGEAVQRPAAGAGVDLETPEHPGALQGAAREARAATVEAPVQRSPQADARRRQLTVQLGARVSAEIAESLVVEAAHQGVTQRELLEKAMRSFLPRRQSAVADNLNSD